MTKPVHFFKLFFGLQLMTEICTHTNSYAWTVIQSKPAYADKDGAWTETCIDELYKLIAIIIYFGLVKLSNTERYWSIKSLYHGLWARAIMCRLRFKALMSVIHIVDPTTEDKDDKLRKVASFVDMFKQLCRSLYQPSQHVAIDERMVRSKHRSGIRQYIRDKPVKWGIKLWVLADSMNGYTYNFDIYIGKVAGQVIGPNGLAYDVVMRLMQPLLNQGYHLYFDNFYSSVTLLKDLFQLGTPACGTVSENRRLFPESLKQGKKWAKRKERGSMRWERSGVCLAIQWIDNKLVSMLSTIDVAGEFVITQRKKKVENKWQTINVQQPQAIATYNKYMNGVDRSDQCWQITMF